MSKLWKDCSTKELVLSYNGILWGLKEECHCITRTYDNIDYVIPQVCTVDFFNAQIKPGMLDAKIEIENILSKRIEEKIPLLILQIMTEEQSIIIELGWDAYKEVKRIGLEYAGRGSA